jgi:hypothetical protein
MTSHQVLDPSRHGSLHIRVGAGAELGDAVMASLAVPAEFRRLACEYPILFRYDIEARTYSALALFGFEPGENLYLEDGRWDATSRPLAMAIQPFLVGRPRSGDGPAQIHIDLAHPRVSTDGAGQPVFDDAGRPTELLQGVADMLAALDEAHRNSATFFEALDRLDLLEPFSMDVTLDNGAAHRMVGYHLVNEEKLKALSAADLAELQAASHLEPLYMALASLGNLGKLIARKNRRLNG